MQTSKLQQLESLLGASVVLRTLSVSEWAKDGGEPDPAVGDAQTFSGGTRIVLRGTGDEIQVCETPAMLTELERKLLRIVLQQRSGRLAAAATDMERQARKLGEWIVQCAAGGEWRAEIPDRIELRSRLFDGMIPFLLLREQAEDQEPSYGDLEKAIRSFITEDTLLVPLREHEWLILAPDRLLAETEALEEEAEIGEEKAILESLAEGLLQMVSGEWGGECHAAVGEPIDPAEGLIRTVYILRETIMLGRKFHVGKQVHLPWLVHLERLLNGIPESVRNRFVEEMVGRPDLLGDPETVSTLDAFFSMDCNVSETAKKLFIHRNTLLYRLDKIKQEAGLDVRSFNDAVLVRILLLLYKVTKRK